MHFRGHSSSRVLHGVSICEQSIRTPFTSWGRRSRREWRNRAFKPAIGMAETRRAFKTSCCCQSTHRGGAQALIVSQQHRRNSRRATDEGKAYRRQFCLHRTPNAVRHYAPAAWAPVQAVPSAALEASRLLPLLDEKWRHLCFEARGGPSSRVPRPSSARSMTDA